MDAFYNDYIKYFCNDGFLIPKLQVEIPLYRYRGNIKNVIEYTDKIEKYEYGGQYHIIKVNSWGYVRFNNWQIYLSETLINEYIEIRPNPLGDSLYACYRNFKIGEFSNENGKLLNRKISRL